jgi:hypothetical protein
MKKTTSKPRYVKRKPLRYRVFSVDLSPAVQQQLLKYGKNNVVAARGNLRIIAEAALGIAMLHRDYIESATTKLVRYWSAEGFDMHNQSNLIESLLKAKK